MSVCAPRPQRREFNTAGHEDGGGDEDGDEDGGAGAASYDAGGPLSPLGEAPAQFNMEHYGPQVESWHRFIERSWHRFID